MRVIHVISSIDKNSGGTSTYLQLLANEIINKISVSIHTLRSDNPLLPSSDVDVNFSRSDKFLTEFKQNLKLCQTDIYHGNGLWQMPVHVMAKDAQNKQIPYIISPHGMLEPWALNAGKWKKKLALALYQRKDLESAACIHTTAKMEAENIRKLGFKNPIAVIPNGIDLNEFPIKNMQKINSKKTILFLSRIHPKKGIEILIDAWSQLNLKLKADWQVEIAGNGEKSYVEALQKEIQEKGLESEIRIVGPQYGEAKLAAYHRADLFVLPTYSENFGIVVAEALACGVPVITTKGTPWEELNKYNAGWYIEIGVASLILALNEALRLTERERQEKGHNGRSLVENKYNIKAVAKQMIELYNWVLEKGDKPNFLYD